MQPPWSRCIPNITLFKPQGVQVGYSCLGWVQQLLSTLDQNYVCMFVHEELACRQQGPWECATYCINIIRLRIQLYGSEMKLLAIFMWSNNAHDALIHQHRQYEEKAKDICFVRTTVMWFETDTLYSTCFQRCWLIFCILSIASFQISTFWKLVSSRSSGDRIMQGILSAVALGGARIEPWTSDISYATWGQNSKFLILSCYPITSFRNVEVWKYLDDRQCLNVSKKCSKLTPENFTLSY
jgi:hypothetical protein